MGFSEAELDAPLLEEVEDALADEAARRPVSTTWRARFLDSSNPLFYTTPYICGQELGERLCFYAISSNLVLFLSKRFGYTPADASAATTSWTGVSYLTAIVGAFVADRWLGRFRTIALGSFLYLLGLVLLCFSPSVYSPPVGRDGVALTSPSTTERAWLWTALYLVSLGTGGIKPNVSTFGADQFDPDNPVHTPLKVTYFSALYVFVQTGSLVATTALVGLQEAKLWTLSYAIATAGLVLSIASFFSGRSRYKHEVLAPREAPPPLSSLRALYAYHRVKVWAILHALPFVVMDGIFWSVYSQMSASFILQGELMNRHCLGIRLPSASMATVDIVAVLVFIPLVDASIFPRLIKRGISCTPARRMGAGYVFAILAMLAAAALEKARLADFREGRLLPVDPGAKPGAPRVVQLSLLWQTVQYTLIGASETLIGVAEADFFLNLSVPGLRSIFMALRLVATALGGFFASAEVKLSPRGWIADDLNHGRLDLFFLAIAVLQTVNLAAFTATARWSPATNPRLVEAEKPVEAAEPAEQDGDCLAA